MPTKRHAPCKKVDVQQRTAPRVSFTDTMQTIFFATMPPAQILITTSVAVRKVSATHSIVHRATFIDLVQTTCSAEGFRVLIQIEMYAVTR
jgi:hypothetical protein